MPKGTEPLQESRRPSKPKRKQMPAYKDLFKLSLTKLNKSRRTSSLCEAFSLDEVMNVLCVSLQNLIKSQVGNKRLQALQSTSKLHTKDGAVLTEKKSAAQLITRDYHASR